MKFLDETGLKFIATKFKELKDSLTNKVDKVTGKDLSTNDYTNEAKAKVDAIPPNPKYTDTVPDLSPYATKYGDLYDEYNERKAAIEELRRYHITDIQSVNTDIKRLDSQKLNKSDIVNDLTTGGVDKALSAEQGKTLYESKLDKTDVKTKLSELTDDATHRLVTDTEKTTWNNKLSSISNQNANYTKVNPVVDTVWGTGTRNLQNWIGDLDERTKNLRGGGKQEIIYGNYNNGSIVAARIGQIVFIHSNAATLSDLKIFRLAKDKDKPCGEIYFSGIIESSRTNGAEQCIMVFNSNGLAPFRSDFESRYTFSVSYIAKG